MLKHGLIGMEGKVREGLGPLTECIRLVETKIHSPRPYVAFVGFGWISMYYSSCISRIYNLDDVD